ncbi:hypothetical protein ACWGJP_11765 [Microbacterium sp. NPDC055903]
MIERTVMLGARAVVFRASEQLEEELDRLIRRLVDDRVEAVEGGEVDLGWDRIRFDAHGDRLLATSKDGGSTRRTVRRDDVTQVLWVLAAWRRIAAVSGTEIVPTYWRDSLYMAVDVLKTSGVLECRRIDIGSPTQWFIGREPFDDALVDRLAGDIARCVELFTFRPEAVAALSLPVGYAAVVDREHGVIEIRDPQGVVLYDARRGEPAGEELPAGGLSADQQRLIDVGISHWRRVVAEDAPLTVEPLPDDGAVVVSHAVRGGGRIYVAADETVLFAGSGAPPHEALEMFRSGRRTPFEQFRRRESGRNAAGSSFAAVPAQGADAPLITEDELAVWGGGAMRRAAWARDLLMRTAVARGVPFDRQSLRYAVTGGSQEIAVVWPDQRETVFVAPDEQVLRAPGAVPDAEAYAVFVRGARTALDEFGPRPPAEGALSREELADRVENLARRAGLDVLRRSAGTIVAVGDIDLYWTVREEDGEIVGYRVERGAYREIARSSAPAVVLAEVEGAVGL